MTTIHVTSNTFTGDAIVSFRYDPEAVDLLKLVVPGISRKWDKAAKTWTVSYLFIDEMIATMRRAGHTVIDSRTDGSGRRGETPRRSSAPTTGWADTLLDAVGPDRVEAVHRALTRVLHPDTATGDTVLMQDLNVARDRRSVRAA